MENCNSIKVAILGSTGSIGTQAIDSLSRLGCQFVFLCGGHNNALLAKQAKELHCPVVGTTYDSDKDALERLLSGTSSHVVAGEKAVCEALEASGATFVIHSIAGLAGIPYAFSAARMGVRIGMANKEVIISAGKMLSRELKKSGGSLIPVDSEHSAIFQCLQSRTQYECLTGVPCPDVNRILLTASGGPFFGKKRSDLSSVTAADALAHPTWKMGGKITIDCATMMNKGFEVLEASQLFALKREQIKVLVHRQSIVHSCVEFTDHAILAQMGKPDMRTCIRYALTYPERAFVNDEPLDLIQAHTLTFDEPDCENFPLLDVAYRVMEQGKSAPIALIASDEEAVKLFMNGKISFMDISDKVASFMSTYIPYDVNSYEEMIEAEQEARNSFLLQVTH